MPHTVKGVNISVPNARDQLIDAHNARAARFVTSAQQSLIMRHDTAPSSRIFGRIDRFDVACPKCGELIRAVYTSRTQHGTIREELGKITRAGKLANRHNQAKAYNPITSTLRCPFCFALYQVGIILWPLKIGRQGYAVPADQRPTAAEARKLRMYAGGFFADEKKERRDPTNVYVTAECTCPIEEGGWAPECPVHGWDAVKAEQNQIDHTEQPPEVEHDEDTTE